jgi:hypothetical protein
VSKIGGHSAKAEPFTQLMRELLRPPEGVPWIWQSLELLKSSRWQGLGINGRRFIEFLMIEHMKHGGMKNGQLLAPRRQLEGFGIGARYVSGAIEETVAAGLVEVKRGLGKRPSLYALTWLPLADGTAASNRWRSTGSVATSQGKSRQTASEGKPEGYPKGSHNGSSTFRREATSP